MKYLMLPIINITLICYSVYGQNDENEYKVIFSKKVADLSHKYTNSMLIPVQNVEDLSVFSGIPTQFSLYRIYAINVNQDAVKQEKYKNKFHIYVALDKAEQKKHIIVDCNNNLDFSDDDIYTYSTKNYDKKSWFAGVDSTTLYLQVDISCSEKKEDYIPTKINIALYPYDSYNGKNSYSTEDEYILNILLGTSHYKQANIRIDDKDICINEFANRHSFIPEEGISDKSTFYLFSPKDSIRPNTSKIGDTVLIVDRKLYLQNKSGHLYIQDLGTSIDSSRVGRFLPTVHAYDIEDNRKININILTKDKYVFIDFWGSWCQPCIASFPHLAKLYQEIKNRDDVLLIGVALEDERDRDKLKKTIHGNNVDWLNLWIKQTESRHMDSILSKLKVESFPTYLILDKSGKIIFREQSSFNTKDAITHFLNLIE